MTGSSGVNCREVIVGTQAGLTASSRGRAAGDASIAITATPKKLIHMATDCRCVDTTFAPGRSLTLPNARLALCRAQLGLSED
jgi:hypothetical protein